MSREASSSPILVTTTERPAGYEVKSGRRLDLHGLMRPSETHCLAAAMESKVRDCSPC
jgi:hypothetical protein